MHQCIHSLHLPLSGIHFKILLAAKDALTCHLCLVDCPSLILSLCLLVLLPLMPSESAGSCSDSRIEEIESLLTSFASYEASIVAASSLARRLPSPSSLRVLNSIMDQRINAPHAIPTVTLISPPPSLILPTISIPGLPHSPSFGPGSPLLSPFRSSFKSPSVRFGRSESFSAMLVRVTAGSS